MRQVRDTAAPYCVVRHRHEASPDECIVQYYSLNNDKQDEPRLIMVIRVRIDISYIIAQANLLPGPQLTASGLVKLLLLRKL